MRETESKSAEAYAKKAAELFREGFNCGQSVLIAFAEELGMTKDEAARAGSSFGGGMGRLRETCGAVAAMLLVVGMKAGYSDPDDLPAKTKQYTLVQRLVGDFRNEFGSIRCRELLGGDVSDSPVPTPRTPEFYASRPCERLIGEAARLAAEAVFPVG